MKRTRMRFVGIAVLLTLMMLGTFVMSAMADDPKVIIVRPDEKNLVFYDGGDGTEPPPHVIILNKDGTVRMIVPNR